MAGSIDRRKFMAGTVAGVAALGSQASGDSGAVAKREFYELRVYKIANAEKKAIVDRYLEKGFVPALNRMGIEPVGVFTRMDDASDHSIYTLIRYTSFNKFAELNDRLDEDGDYLAAAKEYFGQSKNSPAFTRINSRFMRAFKSIPVIELPPETKKKKPRLFELRTYQSHNEQKARLKVEMFDTGETQLMRDVKMQPVFFGEMLVGDDVPNLTYMLSAGDMDAHKAHWKAFIKSDEWNRMKKLARYKGTVSNITKWFLVPTGYSQI